jgi:cyclopropane fatty-acyl-phospholipid synthase-like methyltransferase
MNLSDKAYPFWMRETQRMKIKQILEKVPMKGRVLDVACGPGFLEEMISDNNIANNIVAIDVNPEYVEKTKKVCPGCTAVVMDANEISLSEKFDTIYAIDIVHLLKPDKFFSGVRKVLAPNGKFVITVFCNENNHAEKADWLKGIVKDFNIQKEFLVKAENEWDFCLVLINDD